MQNILIEQNEAIDKAVEQIENQCDIIQATIGKQKIQNLPQVQIWSQVTKDWERINESFNLACKTLIWEAIYT